MGIPNPYFKSVSRYGDLRMEQIIVDYDYPVLFVLKDRRDARYLCVCFDTRGAQQWLVSPITNKELVSLLTNQTALAAPFEDGTTKKVWAVRNYETKTEMFQLVDAAQIPKEYLPESGEYLDAEDGEWDEYIQVLHPTISKQNEVYHCVIPYRASLRRMSAVKWYDIPQHGRKAGEFCYVR